MHRSSLLRLQFGFPKLIEKEKHKEDEEAEKHSQLKEQENSPKADNNETDLCTLTDIEFKMETVKILKELGEDMNSNSDSFIKGTRKYKEEPRKTIKFICRDTN